jgi:hypothetical protein
MEDRFPEERFVQVEMSPNLHGTKIMVSVQTLAVQLLSLSLFPLLHPHPTQFYRVVCL